MKKSLILLFITAFLSLELVSCTDVDYDPFATIMGTVVDDENDEPLSGFQTTMLPGERPPDKSGEGFFQYNKVESGQYTIQVQKTGYQPERPKVYPHAGETYNISFRMKKVQQ